MTSICYRKKAKPPKRKSAQKEPVRPKCQKMVALFRKKIVIIDDESYFPLSNTDLSGNTGYYTSNPDNSFEVKLKGKSKYAPK